jgi:hypothetical protein
MGAHNHLGSKRRLHLQLSRLAGSPPGDLPAVLSDIYHPDAEWRGSHPLNGMSGREAIGESVWAPLLRSFPDLERRDLILAAGTFRDRDYVAALGHYCGTFTQSWLDISATGGAAYIRYGEVHEVRDGLVIQSSCLWDLLDLMRQAGTWPIAPSLGAEGMWPGPITGDGLLFSEQDAVLSAASLQQTLAMQRTLGEYKDDLGLGRAGLLAMPQKQYWHPKMMWYGPSGIGTARGLQGFVDCHQLPFRTAFPNRRGGGQPEDGGESPKEPRGTHYVRIGDGPYSVTGGWPSVCATHLGGGFLGLGPTGRPVNMRVMDFYLHDEGLIRENWVPLDIIDLLMQMGVDIFDRMRSLVLR